MTRLGPLKAVCRQERSRGNERLLGSEAVSDYNHTGFAEWRLTEWHHTIKLHLKLWLFVRWLWKRKVREVQGRPSCLYCAQKLVKWKWKKHVEFYLLGHCGGSSLCGWRGEGLLWNWLYFLWYSDRGWLLTTSIKISQLLAVVFALERN